MSKLIEKIDSYFIEKNYNGGLLISKNKEIILEKGYGYANFEHEIKNSANTVFRIASITKQFTAAGILKLVEMGKVDLQSKISKYFPNYPNGDIITVHHLISNSAGIPNFDLNMDFYDVLHSDNPLLAMINIVQTQELAFEPGTAFYYSVSGYLMLQYIIETVSGLDYETFMKKYFFDKLDMKNTGFEFCERVIKNKAYGYKLNNGKVETSDFIDMRIAGGGGGMYSTLKDLYKWNNSILNFKILSEETTKLIFDTHILAGPGNYYGYGMIIGKGDFFGHDTIRYYHTGGGNGVRSINIIYPKEELQIILISNLEDRDTFNEVSTEVQNMLLNE